MTQQKSQSKQSPQFSRRRFLQLSSLGLAATSLGSLGFDLLPEQAQALARRQSGTLRVAWGTPSTLDPLFASADTEIAFLNAVYDYLIDTNSQYELVPRLASEWSISDDGLTYTLTLREGVTFHDGSPLSPEDVVWTFERLKSDGATAGLYANVSSISVGEGNSVVFTLTETNPDFLFDLSDNHALILKANAEGIGESFNGTGPFILEDYLPGDRSVFRANPDYWGGAASVQNLEFVYLDDTQAAVSALQGGQLDVVLRMDNATFLSLSSDSNLNAVAVSTNGHDLLRLRVTEAPGDDPRVQQALRLATDNQAIFERVQLGFGTVGLNTPIGPLSAYFTDEFQPPARDVEAARALLAEAGYPDGLDLALQVPNSGDRVTFAEVIAAQWEEAGIRVTIEPRDESDYYADEENGWLTSQLGITGWGDRPSPQFYLEQSLKTGAVWNESGFSDPELDELIDLAGSTTDEEERATAYREIQRILVERGPLHVPYFFAQFMVTAAGIEGLEVHPFAGRTNFNSAIVA